MIELTLHLPYLQKQSAYMLYVVIKLKDTPAMARATIKDSIEGAIPQRIVPMPSKKLVRHVAI